MVWAGLHDGRWVAADFLTGTLRAARAQLAQRLLDRGLVPRNCLVGATSPGDGRCGRPRRTRAAGGTGARGTAGDAGRGDGGRSGGSGVRVVGAPQGVCTILNNRPPSVTIYNSPRPSCPKELTLSPGSISPVQL